MMLLVKSTLDATLRLTCPHCHKLQLRAKKPGKDDVYACKHCHKRFKLKDAKRHARTGKAKR